MVFGGLHLLAVPGEGLLDEGLDSRVSVSCGALEHEARLFSEVMLLLLLLLLLVVVVDTMRANQEVRDSPNQRKKTRALRLRPTSRISR